MSYIVKTQREELPDLSSEDEEDEEEYKKVQLTDTSYQSPTTVEIQPLQQNDNKNFVQVGCHHDPEDPALTLRLGGYHPVDIGNVYNNRYEIVSKLGWGHFSTVWKAVDQITGENVALKIVKSAKHYTEAARDEIKILNTTTRHDKDKSSCVIQLLDSFDVEGPHGNHVTMVFEELGCNMLTITRMYKYRGLPLPLVKMIAKQMVIAMEYLHRCLVIHTDLKPENMLFVRTPRVIMSMSAAEREKFFKDTKKADSNEIRKVLPWSRQQLIDTFGEAFKVKVVDLGNACWTFEHFTEDVQTRQYRAPEVILGIKYTQAIDVWSMACIVFELLTGDLLFEPKSGRTFEKDDDHMAQISELVGPLPLSMAHSGTNSRRLYNPEGQLRNIKSLKAWPLKDVLREKYKFVDYEAEEIADFLNPMLVPVPEQRATAARALDHPWIRDVDVSNFESCLAGWF